MQTTNYRRPISPSEHLAICLHFLATSDSCHTIANSYRVGMSTVADGFRDRWAFPNCADFIDGKHVVIKTPDNIHHRVVGSYGRKSDGTVLANSIFGQKLMHGTLGLSEDTVLPGAERLGPQPFIFVADKAFPLRHDVMRPFPGRSSGSHRMFNYRLSHARLIVENTFGIPLGGDATP
ncbi:uncharacterized protein V6R79_009018 [Siganus canaliculatus]